jgi:type I site-specific restriction-modification system R (restriction) subunit
VKFKMTGVLLAAAVLAWLAVSAMKSSVEISRRTDYFNLYVNQGPLAHIELKSRADEMRERLTYMVFEKERLEAQ